MVNTDRTLERLSSGIQGLDSLLHGGFVRDRMYLVIGAAGTGKTLLGMEFLRDGLDAGEDVLFIHGEESKENILTNGAQLDIDLDGADFLDIGPESDFFRESQSYDIVDPQDVQDERVIEDIRAAIVERDPSRVLIDPLSQLQYVEPTEYQFRKRIIAFMRFLLDRGTTVLATKTPSQETDSQLLSLSDGVIQIQREPSGRRIGVPKHRGVGQRDGTHGMEIRQGGIEVYPALDPEQHSRAFEPTQFSSGIDGLDELLGGGFERGTVTIISGPSGVGKSTTATAFLQTEAEEHGAALAYLFEESIDTFTYRSETFGIPINRLREEGALTVEAIEPLARSPEEFARMVQTQVEDYGAELVVIDGIDGYKAAIQGEDELGRELHALTRYLTNMNVSVILIDEISNVTGIASPTSSNVSYIADNILFQNYVELEGHLQRVAGVLKKRVGGFEDTLRRFTITDEGITIGEPLTNVRGIVEGTPEWNEDDF